MPENTPQPGWTYKPGDNSENTQNSDQPSPEEASRIISEASESHQNSPQDPSNSPPAINKSKAEGAQHHDSITWTASEFVMNHKTTGWYMLFTLCLGILGGIIYFITRDFLSVSVIFIAGILFIILAGRKPRQLTYVIDEQGISMGEKFYPYSLFKSFGVGHEGVIGSINLMPLKRFMPELSIYYPTEEENKIIDTLSEYLPHDQREEAGVDRLLRRMRF